MIRQFRASLILLVCGIVILGFSRTQAVGRVLAEMIIPPAHREAHERGLATYLATGVGPVLDRRIEITALRSDGSEIPVELSIAAVRTTGEPVFVGYLRDISERKRSEAALHDINRQLEERVAPQDERLGLAEGDGGRRARRAVQQRQGAEELTRLERRDDRRLAVLGRRQDDLDRAGHHDVECVAGVVLMEDRLAAAVRGSRTDYRYASPLGAQPEGRSAR